MNQENFQKGNHGNQNTGTGFVIVLVLYILLAIIIGNNFY